MEEMKDKKVCDCAGGKCACAGANGCGCGCGHGCWYGRHRFFILRIVLAVIVVVAAFWIGMRLGELKAAYNSASFGGRGSSRMMQYPPVGGYYGRAGGVPAVTSTPTN
jgi:hypothetical protein